MDFKLIIAGGREFADKERMHRQLLELVEDHIPVEDEVIVVSGMARGADRLAYEICAENGYECIVMPADWDTHGKRAGYMRNTEMAKIADGLLAYWDGRSKGTKHMIDTARKLGLKVWVELYS
jgi:hypothetical protein